MSGPAGITVNAADLESAVTLSSDSRENLEKELVALLAKNINAEYIANNSSNNSFQGMNGHSLYSRAFSSEEIESFDVLTSSGLKSTTGTNALLTYTDFSEASFAIHSETIINSVSVATREPSAPYYDSNIKFLNTVNDDPCYLVGNNDYTLAPENQKDESPTDWYLNFDMENSNVNLHRVVNSEFSNTQNQNLMWVKENTVFNTTYAMGQDPTKYYTLENITESDQPQVFGQPALNDMPQANMLTENGFTVSKVDDFVNFDTTKTGIYAFQVTDNIPIVNMAFNIESDSENYTRAQASDSDLAKTIQFYGANVESIQTALGISPTNISGSSGLTVGNGVYLNQMGEFYTANEVSGELMGSDNTIEPPSTKVQTIPLVNATNGLALPLPTTFSLQDWLSLFDTETERPQPDYQFTLFIEENLNAGYSFDYAALVNNSPGTEPVLSLNSGNLVDNVKYMKDLVSLNHSISLSPATLTIVQSVITQGLPPQLVAGALPNIDSFEIIDGREALPQNLVGVDGSIAINTNTPSTRTTSNVNMAPEAYELTIPEGQQLSVSVFYNDEDTFERYGISNQLKTSSYVGYTAQLAYKSPVYSNTYLKKSDGIAALNFYAEGVGLINESVAAGDIDFFIDYTYQAQEVEILRVSTEVNLMNSGSLLSNSDNTGTITTPIPNVNAHVSITNLSNIQSSDGNMEYLTKAQINFVLKSLDSSYFYASCVSRGWNLASSGDNKMVSSSISAYSPNAWPTEAQTTNLISGNLDSINYTITNSIGNVGSTSSISSNNSNMADILNITWDDGNSLIFHYDGDNIMKRTDYSTGPVQNTLVSSTDYNLPPSLSSKNVVLTKITTTRHYKLQVKDCLLRGYKGLTLTTPLITSTSTEYNLTDSTNPSNTYTKTFLNGISKNPQDPDYFARIETTVSPVSLSGILYPNDFKNLQMQLFAFDNDQGIVRPLTEIEPISSMYGITSAHEFVGSYEETVVSGDINITLGYDCIDTNGNEHPLYLDNPFGYQIKLVGSYDLNYQVEHFASSAAGLFDNEATNISGNNNNYLTPGNGYANITGWNTNAYKIVHEISGSTSILYIKSMNGSYTLGAISLLNNTFLGSTALIALGQKDVFKVSKRIGNTSDTADFSQWFVSTDYPFTNQGNGYVTLEDGVYVDRGNGNATLDRSTLQSPGHILSFELLPDYIGVNMVGSLDMSPLLLYPITYTSTNAPQVVPDSDGLKFQYSYDDYDTHYFSRVLELPIYRGYERPMGGYYSPVGNLNEPVIQLYTIQRDKSVMTFKITNNNNEVLASQNFDAYAGLNAIVDNLSNLYGSIGLSITSNYSMLSEEESSYPSYKSYPVNLQGDYVKITVSNPNVTPEPSTQVTSLKNYNIYEFTGHHFANTGAPLSIVPTKLKMSSGEITHTNIVYGIDLFSGYTNVYYDQRYLGNPAEKSGNPTNVRSSITNWAAPTFMETHYDYYEIKEGIYINGYKITSTSSFNSPSISYWTVTPPYLFMNQRGINNTNIPEHIPLDSESRLNNNYTVGFPISGYNDTPKNEYNPFTNTSYNYIDSSTTTGVQSISFSSDIINNVTLTDNTNKTASQYATNSNSTQRRFAIEGNKLDMTMYLGLSDENQVLLNNLFNNIPSSRLLFIGGQTDNNKLMWKNSEFSLGQYPSRNGVYLDIRQRLNIANIYQNHTDAEFLDTTAALLPANITLDVGSFFITGDFPLDLQAGDGLKTYFYNSNISINSTTGEGKVIVNKYSSPTRVDFHSVDSNAQLQTSIIFNQKHTIEYNIPSPSIPKSSVLDISSYLNDIDTDEEKTWQQDTSFLGTELVNILMYSQDSMLSILPELFVTKSTGEAKVFLKSELPALVIKGKIGNTILQINTDGTILAPNVSTKIVTINSNTTTMSNIINGTALKNYTQLYSIDGYKM